MGMRNISLFLFLAGAFLSCQDGGGRAGAGAKGHGDGYGAGWHPAVFAFRYGELYQDYPFRCRECEEDRGLPGGGGCGIN